MHSFTIHRSRGAAIGALVGCIAAFVPASAEAPDTDAMLTNYITALNANMPPKLDPAAIAGLFAEDAVQHHAYGRPLSSTNEPDTGREAIEAFFAGFDAHFSDWTHVETRRTIQGSRAVWEGVAQGTHKETGKPVEVPIVFSMEFDESGLVKETLAYVNGGYIARQLE